ncbi:MAG TPA: ABC transporter permease/substrate-binding protein [Rhizomicrobium sp.]|nr:ABC transporter permease/substrate-binding protein [Rhizomicrobium sp.]
MDSNLREAWALLPDYLSQHVLVSLSAIVLGTAISLPLAMVAARNRHLRGPLLGFASIVQTIPGLALLALFYPLLLALSLLTKSLFGWSVPALGFLPSVLALTLYSMLPVLRNTVTALLGIDPAVTMAAKGVGMTERQSLFLVELPLAAPVIVAGVRTATVWVVGTATLSTPVGQTSLGNYIFTGLQTENWVLVLFGCVAAALLALVLDQLLALAGRGLAQRSRARIMFAGAGLLIVLGISLVPAANFSASTAPEIIIGAKNFDEQYILADLMADRLDHAGFRATTRSDLGSTIAFHALAGRSIDMYIDYSGTLWANEMHRRDMPGRQAMLDQLRDWLARRHAITLYGALGFENAYVFAMRADRARALHIDSLADLAAHARDMKVGGDFEIFSRPEWRSVVRTYGLSFAVQRTYQADFLYRAVTDGDVDVISAFSSDGRIQSYNLKILADPKGALPPYDAVLLVGPRYADNPSVRRALMPLVGRISLDLMQKANFMVDRPDDKKSPGDAAAWLDHQLTH